MFIHLKRAYVFFYAYFGHFIHMLEFLYFIFHAVSHNLHKNIQMETQLLSASLPRDVKNTN